MDWKKQMSKWIPKNLPFVCKVDECENSILQTCTEHLTMCQSLFKSLGGKVKSNVVSSMPKGMLKEWDGDGGEGREREGSSAMGKAAFAEFVMNEMGRKRPSERGHPVQSLELNKAWGILNQEIIWSSWNVMCLVRTRARHALLFFWVPGNNALCKTRKLDC